METSKKLPKKEVIKMKYVSNTLSLGMMSCEEETQLNIEPICEEQFVIETLNAHSIVAKPKIAEKMGVKCNKEHIELKKGDTLYVSTSRKVSLDSLYKTFMGRPRNEYYRIEVGYI